MRALLSLTLALPCLASCALPSLEVQPRYARLDISGSAGYATGGTGGAADLEQAGLDSDDALGGRIDFKFGSPHLIVMGQAPSYEGSGTLDVTVSDGTDTITGGADVDTALDIGQYTLALVFDLVPGDTVEVALGLGASYLDVDSSFTEQGTSTTVSSTESLPLPLLVGVASVWIGPVELSALVSGFSVHYSGDSVSYYDADFFARWKVFGGSELLRASLVAGYRLTDFQLEYDDDTTAVDLDLSLRGPYLGLEVSL